MLCLMRSFLYTAEVRSFSYTPQTMFGEDLFVISLELVLVKSLSYTPRAGFSEEFLLHSSSCV